MRAVATAPHRRAGKEGKGASRQRGGYSLHRSGVKSLHERFLTCELFED
jgi:hypothetical protein